LKRLSTKHEADRRRSDRSPAPTRWWARDGKFYAVPINIHSQNWLFYNTKIFAEASL
jgi:ABC-type glycerol-3-phosphate transport system substrate-binding protein